VNAASRGDAQTVFSRGLSVAPIVASPIPGQSGDHLRSEIDSLGHRDRARGADGEGQGGRAIAVAFVVMHGAIQDRARGASDAQQTVKIFADDKRRGVG